MIAVTLGVAVMFVMLAITRRNNGTALGILVMSMLLWPEFLRVPMGILQMSAPRFVAVFLLIKFMSQGQQGKINFGKADVFVILTWIWTVIATILANAAFSEIAYVIGRGFDTVLMYFVARFSLTNSKDIKGLLFALGVTASVMCLLGIYESLTWHSPYHRWNNGEERIGEYDEIRYGMLRAAGSTMVSIYFGMAMMLVTGMLWSMRGYVLRRKIFMGVIMAAAIATLSSLSSGPLLAFASLVGFNLYNKRPSLIKPSLFALLIMMIAIEFASNRHFYNLIDYLAMDPTSAWYRTRLLEVAVTHWQDYWLLGVGSNWPHYWTNWIDGREFIDVVNNFLIVALYGGLPALFMYLASHVIAIKLSVVAFKSDKDIAGRQLVFGLAATLIAFDFASMSVGAYGPALLLSYVVLGLTISASTAYDNLQAMPNQAGSLQDGNNHAFSYEKNSRDLLT